MINFYNSEVDRYSKKKFSNSEEVKEFINKDQQKLAGQKPNKIFREKTKN